MGAEDVLVPLLLVLHRHLLQVEEVDRPQRAPGAERHPGPRGGAQPGPHQGHRHPIDLQPAVVVTRHQAPAPQAHFCRLPVVIQGIRAGPLQAATQEGQFCVRQPQQHIFHDHRFKVFTV